MRLSDIERITKVICCSGIGTHTQRDAICQRIRDWFYVYSNLRDKEQPHELGSDLRTPPGGKP